MAFRHTESVGCAVGVRRMLGAEQDSSGLFRTLKTSLNCGQEEVDGRKPEDAGSLQ